jgi:acyl carrier protein
MAVSMPGMRRHLDRLPAERPAEVGAPHAQGESVKSVHAITHEVLAHHVDHDPDSIRMWHSLRRDLDLTPLEIVLVVLEVEDKARVRVTIDELAEIQTVGDLYMCLSKAASRQRGMRACA